MRIKTIVIVVIAIVLTIVLMQNTGRVDFNFLWTTFWVSKLTMLFFVALISFVLGFLVGRPKRIRRLGGDYTDNNYDKPNSGTLSDEDKNYIN